MSFQVKVLEELKEVGCDYQDVEAIFKNDKLLPIEVEIILRYLPSIYREHVGTGDVLVRSLLSATKPINPKVLIDLYDNSDLNSCLKWSVGYVIAKARTTDVSDWLKARLLENSTFQSSSLINAINKKLVFQSDKNLKTFIRNIFDGYIKFEAYQKLLVKYLNKDDRDFILDKCANLPEKLKKECLKVISKIEKKGI